MGMRSYPIIKYDRKASLKPKVEYARDEYQIGSAGPS